MKLLKTKLQKTGYVLGIALSAFVLGTLLQFAKAWSEPSVAPPSAEIGAPINTSANYQDKAGVLGSDSGFITSGSISAAGAVQGGTELCIGTDCRTAWPTSTPTPGDNMGNEIATGDMNMAGYSIQNVNTIKASTVNAAGLLVWGDSNFYGDNVYGINFLQTNTVTTTGMYASGWAFAGTYYDANNSGYYVIPSGTSNLNAVNANSIKFGDGTVQTSAGIAKSSCTVRSATSASVLYQTLENISCNTGEIATGGGCTETGISSTPNIPGSPIKSSSNVPTGWSCGDGNTTLFPVSVTADVICCK